MSGGSSFEGKSSFMQKQSTTSIKIKGSVRIIKLNDFLGCNSFTEVLFSSESQLRVIDGFQKCTSLHRIEIPSSVEKIGKHGFFGCTSLTEIIFLSESHLREIDGFQKCTSLHRIEIPSAIEKIADSAFFLCQSLRVVVIHTRCEMRNNRTLQGLRPFLVYEDDDVKYSRRMLHLGVGGRRIQTE
jgi:aminoglycoside N3'-acetyltransferase